MECEKFNPYRDLSRNILLKILMWISYILMNIPYLLKTTSEDALHCIMQPNTSKE